MTHRHDHEFDYKLLMDICLKQIDELQVRLNAQQVISRSLERESAMQENLVSILARRGKDTDALANKVEHMVNIRSNIDDFA